MSDWDEMRPHPKVITGGLRKNWDEEERVFASVAPLFSRKIAPANTRQREVLYVFESEPEPVKLAEKSLENPAAEAGKPKNFVESSIVGGHHKIGPPTMQPESESEEPMSTTPNTPKDDILDDILGVSETKAEPKVASSPTPARADGADVFDFDTSPKPAALQSADPPKAKDLDTEISAQMSAVAAEVRASKKSESAPKMKTETKEGEFDNEKFAKVLATVDRMLERTVNVDLDYLLATLKDYVVTWEVDHLRERPNVVTDKMLDIQAKRTSLFAVTYHVIPAYYAMKHAADYITDAGIECSTASNREKRQAQVLFATADFWVRFAKVVSTKETIDYTIKLLDQQYECVSRLISGWQVQNKIGEISRSGLPFEPSVEPQQPQQMQAPAPSAPTQRPVAPQGLTSDKFKQLESFDPTKKQQQVSISGTMEVDF